MANQVVWQQQTASLKPMVQPCMQTNIALTCIVCHKRGHDTQIASKCYGTRRLHQAHANASHLQAICMWRHVQAQLGTSGANMVTPGDTVVIQSIEATPRKAGHRAWRKLCHHILTTFSGVLKALSTNSVATQSWRMYTGDDAQDNMWELM